MRHGGVEGIDERLTPISGAIEPLVERGLTGGLKRLAIGVVGGDNNLDLVCRKIGIGRRETIRNGRPDRASRLPPPEWPPAALP